MARYPRSRQRGTEHNGGCGVLEAKDAVEAVEAVGRTYLETGWGNSKEQVRAREIMMGEDWRQGVSYGFERDGWEQEVTVDAVKDGILVDYGRIEQMETSWDVLKGEAIARLQDVSVEVIALLGPDSRESGFEGTRSSLVTLLDPLVRFETPIFIWKYPIDAF